MPEQLKPYDPWRYAAEVGRDYITPEDITTARGAFSADPRKRREESMYLMTTVLWAINRRLTEDHTLCAFVACNPVNPDIKRIAEEGEARPGPRSKFRQAGQ